MEPIAKEVFFTTGYPQYRVQKKLAESLTWQFSLLQAVYIYGVRRKFFFPTNETLVNQRRASLVLWKDLTIAARL